MLDLPRPVALSVAILFFVAQGTLIATASSRPERAFGFQMFPEASLATIHLAREVRMASKDGGDPGPTRVVPIVNGTWRAKGADGVERTFRWTDRMRYSYLQRLDREGWASYGASAHMSRLQGALDDLATHTPEDTETVRFLARVELSKNGRPATLENLASVAR